MTTKVRKPDGGRWIQVASKYQGGHRPAFLDLALQVLAIMRCEDIKYPHGEGGAMLLRFLTEAAECCGKGMEWADVVDELRRRWPGLVERYQLPREERF